MPMCDAYIPTGALEPDAERVLVGRVTDLLVKHEVRRIVDLLDDPEKVEASHKRAKSIAWTFVHRADTYVAGERPEAPHYKFLISIPEGQIDDAFRDAVVPEIVDAVAEAEGGTWPHPAFRVWVFTHEVPDGAWGGAGQTMRLRQIVDVVAPGMGQVAEARFDRTRREAALATVALAEGRGATA